MTAPSTFSEQDIQTFKEVLRIAQQGSIRAQAQLGWHYFKGQGVPKNDKAAFSWFKKAAKQGHLEAQTNLGQFYLVGVGTVKDEEAAFSWFQKAAEKGKKEAQTKLGQCYLHGWGTVKNEQRAFFWFEQAANNGDLEGQEKLGLCYARGVGTLKNEETAFSWFKKAADKGEVNAQNDLGLCYLNGWGTVKNEETAFSLFKKAAEGGQREAQFNLAQLYREGKGIAKDEKAAFALYKKAADNGHLGAQNNLGYCYSRGIGVARDLEQARNWYQRAAAQGDATAKENAELAAIELKQQQITAEISTTPALPNFQNRRPLAITEEAMTDQSATAEMVTSAATRTLSPSMWSYPMRWLGRLASYSKVGLANGLWRTVNEVASGVTASTGNAASVASDVSLASSAVHASAKLEQRSLNELPSAAGQASTAGANSQIAFPSVTELAHVTIPILNKLSEQRGWFGHKPLSLAVRQQNQRDYQEQLEKIAASLYELSHHTTLSKRAEYLMAQEAFTQARLRFERYFQDRLDPTHKATEAENAEIVKLLHQAQDALSTAAALQQAINKDPHIRQTLKAERATLSAALQAILQPLAENLLALKRQKRAIEQAWRATDLSPEREKLLDKEEKQVDKAIHELSAAQEERNMTYGPLRKLLRRADQQLAGGCLPHEMEMVKKHLALVKAALQARTANNLPVEAKLLAQANSWVEQLEEAESRTAARRFENQLMRTERNANISSATHFFATTGLISQAKPEFLPAITGTNAIDSPAL